MAPNTRGSGLVDLCTSTNESADGVAQSMVQYLNLSRTHVKGLCQIATVFLEVCQTLIPMTRGIRTTEVCTNLSHNNIRELEKRIGSLATNFTELDLLLKRVLHSKQKKGLIRVANTFGMLFLELDIHKLWEGLSKGRETLKASSLPLKGLFQEDCTFAEMGRQYARLATKLKLVESQRPRTLVRSWSAPPKYESISVKKPEFMPYSDWANMKLDVASITITEVAETEPEPTRAVEKRFSKLSGATLVNCNSASNATHLLQASSQPPAQSQQQLPPIRVNTNRTKPERRASGRRPSHVTMDSLVAVEEMLDENECSAKSVASLTHSNRTDQRRVVSRVMPEVNSEPMKAALVAAVQQRNQNLVKELLDLGVNPDSVGKVSLLHIALRNRDLPTLQLLLSYGTSISRIDSTSQHGCNVPLFTAIYKDFLGAIEVLVQYGARLDKTYGTDNDLPQQFAARLGRIELVEVFLEKGGEVNNMPNGNTLLISAITQNGTPTLLSTILRKGAQVNLKNAEGKTALYEALSLRRLDLAETIIDAGADVNMAGPNHPLFPAIYDANMLSVLICHGADLDKAPGLLESAVSINNTKSVKMLLDAGVSPNVKHGIYLPLCSAIRDGRQEMMAYLLRKGADPNMPGDEYPTFACLTKGQSQLLPELVAKGADLHTPGGILQVAIARRQRDAITYLLEQGVDVNAEYDGHTPLTTAIDDRDIVLVETLLRHGASPATRGSDWPLAMAVHQPQILRSLLPHVPNDHKVNGIVEKAVAVGQFESVRRLLAAGFSVEDRTGGVFSPLTTAIREDRLDIVTYLLQEANANVDAPGEHLPVIQAIQTCSGRDDHGILELVLAHGADVNLFHRGWNAVMFAIEAGDLQILQTLVDWGNLIDFGTCDENNRTIRELVIERGWREGTVLLLGDDV